MNRPLAQLLHSIANDYRYGKPGTTDFVVAWADARHLHLADHNQEAMEDHWVDLSERIPHDLSSLPGYVEDLTELEWMVEAMDSRFLG